MEMEQFPVTPRQKEFLNAVSRLTAAKGGVGPTYQEVADEMEVSYGAAIVIAKRLIARGRLRQLPRSARTLKVIKERPSA